MLNGHAKAKLVSLGVLGFGLVFCGAQQLSANGSAGSAAMAASPAVQEILSDGSVTIDEYESAFRDYASCMNEAGFSVAQHEPDANGVINYSISNEAVANGVDDECYDEHYNAVDTAFQVAREDSSSSAESLRECLRAEGIDPAETMTALLKQFESRGLDLGDC